MQLKINLTKKFVISSILAFLVIGSILSYIVSFQLKEKLITNKKNEIAMHVADHAKIYLPQKSFTKPDLLKYGADFEELLRAIGYLHAEKIKFYDKTGAIIYSDELELVGQNHTNSELDETFKTGLPVAAQVGEGKEEHKSRSNKEKDSKHIEIYLPVTYENFSSPSGVIEVYIDITDLFVSISEIQKTIWLTISLSLLFLFVILYWIFKKASNTILEKNRALKEVTKTLSLAQDQDEAILESMEEGLIVINKNNQILLYNPKVEVITKYSSQDVLFRHYKNFIDLRDKDGKKIKENIIKNALEKGLVIRKSYKDNINVKDRYGKLIPIALTIAPIIGKKANIRGLVFTIHDSRTEKELDNVRDEFVYIVAHELGNPIFAVNGYLSMALDGSLGKLNGKLKESITSAKTVNDQLSTLVSDLLEVIRSESGHMQFETENINIGDVILEIIKNSSYKAKKKKIKLEYIEKDIPLVIANQDKVKEIITNLVDNAIKYSPEKTNIKISHEILKEGVVTHVKDTGFGISEKERENLFEKFYRIRNDETKHISGTGLGLFIVKTLVEKMNGEIWVDSKKDKGTTFSFTLKRSNKKEKGNK